MSPAQKQLTGRKMDENPPAGFWIFRKILGWEREIDSAPKPSPEVAPSKMEVAPS